MTWSSFCQSSTRKLKGETLALGFYQTFLTFELPVSLSSVGVTMNLQCSHSIIAVLSPALVTKPLWAKTVVPYAM